MLFRFFMLLFLAFFLRFSFVRKPLGKNFVRISTFVLLFVFARSILILFSSGWGLIVGLYYVLWLLVFLYTWSYTLSYKPKEDVAGEKKGASGFVADFRADINEVVKIAAKQPVDAQWLEKIKRKLHPISDKKTSFAESNNPYTAQERSEAVYSKKSADIKGYVKNYKKNSRDILASLAMGLAIFIFFVGIVLALYAYADPAGFAGLMQGVVPLR